MAYYILMRGEPPKNLDDILMLWMGNWIVLEEGARESGRTRAVQLVLFY